MLQTAETSVGADYKALLANAPFRRLLFAHFASNIGDWLAFMALFSLVAFEWNGGVFDVAIMAIAYMLPFGLVAPIAGVFVDRWDLRRVMIAADALRIVVVLSMAACGQFWLMALLLFLHQALSTFFNPAQHAAIPRLVARHQILAANALNTQGAHFTKILGPGVAGLVVAAVGARGCFFIDAVTFAASALLLWRLPSLPAVRDHHETPHWFEDLRAGLAYVRGAARLQRVLLILSICICALGAFTAVLPIFARDQLGVGPRLMGLLLSGMGFGAVGGAIIVTHAGKRWDKLHSIAAGGLISGLAVGGLAWIHSVHLAILATTQLGIGIAALLIPAYALLQEETPSMLLGRVVSLSVTLVALSQVLGMGAASAASKFWQAPDLVFGMGVMLSIAALLLAGLPSKHMGSRQ